jgi:hypothetical protein
MLIEMWSNNVFMQFNRQKDNTFRSPGAPRQFEQRNKGDEMANNYSILWDWNRVSLAS